jgi:hypothetical protein
VNALDSVPRIINIACVVCVAFAAGFLGASLAQGAALLAESKRNKPA